MKRSKAKPRAALENVEPRRLLSTIDADDYFAIYTNHSTLGTVITSIRDFAGGPHNDRISVFRGDKNQLDQLVVSVNGMQTVTSARELYIDGRGGNDKIVIDPGDEDADVKITINGGDGNDTLWGGSCIERIYGGNGDDLINGNGGKDTIYGEAGNDFIRGGGSSDLLDGADGYDTIFGDAGNDNISGGANPDRLRGSVGNDRLEGNGGRDLMAGEAGDDSLFGGAGEDVLDGGGGMDVLRGGTDHDQVFISGLDGDDFDVNEASAGESVDADVIVDSVQTSSGAVAVNSGATLTKTGGGVLTLSGTNTFTRSTTIVGGTLAVASGTTVSVGTLTVSNG